MSQLSLILPETLHQQLINLAEKEGVSLDQYIIYALTRQVTSKYTMIVTSEVDRAQQSQQFEDLLVQLGEASPSQIEKTLAKRETIEPEKELTPEIINKFHQLIKNQSSSLETNE